MDILASNAFPLTQTQRDIYFDQLHYASSPKYNVGGYIELPDLDEKRIAHAHRQLVMQYDAFGIRIVESGDGVEQYICGSRELELPVIDFSQHDEPASASDAWLTELFETPLAFNDCALFRAYLIKVSESNYRYVGFAHHLAMDGWGFSNWASELLRFYQQDNNESLKGCQWREVVNRDKKYLSSEKYQKDKLFWQTYLHDLPDKLLKPRYYGQQSGAQASSSRRFVLPVSDKLHTNLAQLATNCGVTPAQLYLAVFAFYFARAHESDEVVMGLPSHNRRKFDEKHTIGVFTTVSPLRMNVDMASSFKALCQSVAKQQKQTFRHVQFPYGDITNAFGAAAGDDLYQIAFNYLRLNEQMQLDGSDVDLVYLSHNHETTPIMITCWEYGEQNGLEVQLDVNQAYFSHHDMSLLTARINNLLIQLATMYERNLSELSMMTADEVAAVKRFSNGADTPIPNASLTSLFEQQVRINHAKTALVTEKIEMTYAELGRSVDRIAMVLLAKNVVVGDRVGVHLARTENMIIAILAVMKVGGVYVPLDPKYPDARLALIIEDADIKLLISEQGLSNVQSFETLSITRALLQLEQSSIIPEIAAPEPQATAYIIYTSGSTGVPKGVQISHQNAVAMLTWAYRNYDDNELSRVLACTSLNFDLSIFEMFVPLCGGFECVLVEDALALIDKKQNITLINAVPSAMEALIQARCIPESVKVINLAGEPLKARVVNDIFKYSYCQKVYNLYGPSEDTTYSTAKCYERPISTEPTIGRVIDNSQAYVLTSERELTPLGEIGELYLAGAGVSIGYLNRPELNKSSFIDNPYGKGKIYKTGDLVRFESNGELEYVGRKDHQVKIRGFRIELGEIEHHLLKDERVMSACVVINEDEKLKQRIVAYVTIQKDNTEKKSLLEQVLIAELSNQLPNHMVPERVICIDELPTLPNGKIDKAQLKKQSVNVSTSDSKVNTEIYTVTERALVAIYKELLSNLPSHLDLNASFFGLGGNSILAVRLRSEVEQKLGKILPLRVFFKSMSLHELAKVIDQQPINAVNEVIPVVYRSTDRFPLSYSQNRIWFIDHLNDGSPEYNMVSAFAINRKYSSEQLSSAFSKVIEKHTALRTTFHEEDGIPFQQIQQDYKFSMDALIIDSKCANELVDKRNEIIAKESLYNFDISAELLIRAKYLSLCVNGITEENVLVVNIHHIAFDGWSLAILIRELNNALQMQNSGKSDVLQYVDYASFQRQQSNYSNDNEHVAYWLNKLADLPDVHSIPLDFERTPGNKPRAKFVKQALSCELSEYVYQTARHNDMTLFMLVHAALALLLSRHGDNSDIAVGMPVANRPKRCLESTIGFFVNTLVLRLDCDFQTIEQLFSAVKRVNQDALTYQDVPFEYLVEQLCVDRNSTHNPLFQIMLSQNVLAVEDIRLGEEQTRVIELEQSIAKYDLELAINETVEGIRLDWTYNAELFSDARIQQFSQHLSRILQGLCVNKHSLLADINMYSEEELRKIIEHNANGDNYSLSDNEQIHHLFEQNAMEAPQKIALEFNSDSISYGELNSRANKLAQLLTTKQSLMGAVVGVCMSRTDDMLVSMLAILKTGAAYVPLDPKYPQNRLAYILCDSRANIVVSDSSADVQFANNADVLVVQIDDESIQQELAGFNCDNFLAPYSTYADSLAYIIYTSGSTGQPKGVEILHRNAVAMVRWALRYFDDEELTRVFASTSINFDLSIFELFVPLSKGTTCVLAENAMALHEQSLDVTLINTVPSAIKALIESDSVPAGVKTINLAGEPLPKQLVNTLLENKICQRVNNLYGPSEDTTYSTVKQFDSVIGELPTIGKAVDNTCAYVVAKDGSLLMPGIAGELYLSGAGVSRGYRNNKAMTESRFMADRFRKNTHFLMYRTGDLVKLLPNGELAYLGRIDNQVKIRGFRIELEEIEAQLSPLPFVEQAIVNPYTSDAGDVALVAYLVAQQGVEQYEVVARAKAFLSANLPDYMQPSSYVFMPELPLNHNGKINRKALPAPELLNQNENVELPQSILEKQIALIWSSLLNIALDKIGRNSSFFVLGGHSLLAVRLAASLKKNLNVDIKLSEIFEHATIGALAHWIEQNERAVTVTTDVTSLHSYEGDFELTSAQQRIWLMRKLSPEHDPYTMPSVISVNGNFNQDLANKALGLIVSRHQALQLKFFEKQGRVYQSLQEEVRFELTSHDLTQLDEPERNAQLELLIEENSLYQFDLNDGEVLKVSFVRLSSQLDTSSGVLLFNMHHIISDGWSLGILVNEFVQYYKAFELGDTIDESPLSIQFLDYVHWQRAENNTQAFDKQLDYWQKLLDGAPGCHALPTFDRSTAQETAGEFSSTLNKTSVLEIQRLSHSVGATLFMYLQTALSVHIGRLSAETDVVIGSPIAGRFESSLESIIGLFLDIRAYRTTFSENPTFIQLLSLMKQQHLDSSGHGQVPFEQIVERLNPERGHGHSPIFQVLINYDNSPTQTLTANDCQFIHHEPVLQQGKYDITLYVSEGDDGDFTLKWVYQRGLFSGDMIKHYADTFIGFVEQINANPELGVLDYSWPDKKTLNPVQLKRQPTSPNYILKFERHASAKPEHLALIAGDVRLTYSELNLEVNKLAHYLMSQGVNQGDRVIVAVSRSHYRIIAILASIKLGACFVPFSEELNQTRLQQMYHACNAQCIIVDDNYINAQNWLQLHSLEQRHKFINLSVESTLNDISAHSETNPVLSNVNSHSPAHIIFTSGSTGVPKGVVGTYGATNNRIMWMLDEFPYMNGECAAHITSMAFIRGIWELLVPICAGTSLVLFDRGTVRDTHAFINALISFNVTRIVTAPSLMKAATAHIEGDALKHLKYWFVSGEPLIQKDANEFLNKFTTTELINLYGSTEVMSDVTYFTVSKSQQHTAVPIGSAIDNCEVEVLDRNKVEVPPYVIGEITVSGHPLAQGYLTQATANSYPFERFDGKRRYFTGDLGFVDNAGQLHCLGRIDDQIKIRGFRIEPGEIANVIAQHDSVSACCVTVFEQNSQTYLAAYIVPQANSTPNNSELLELTRAKLPGYMQPAAFEQVGEIPLKPNGKIDKQRLPDVRLRASSKYTAPESAIEKSLVSIWSDVLAIPESTVGVQDSFFELGGHSLLVNMMLVRVESQYAVSIAYQRFFKHSTIAFLAQEIEAATLVKSVVKTEDVNKKNSITI